MRSCLALILLAPVSTVFAQSTAAQPTPISWVGTWAAAPFGGDSWHTIPTLAETTVREIVHTSIAGNAVRVRFTNEWGNDPLQINAATIATSTGVSTVDTSSLHDLTFGGSPSIVVPPGAVVVTDPVAMATPASATLAISLYLPLQQISSPTVHSLSQQDNFIQTGNHVHDASFAAPVDSQSWYFLKGVDVQPATAGAAAIVAIGDSITDGAESTANANHRWPDYLFARLQGNGATANRAMLDEGIGGNCVLVNCAGSPNAVARFDRDVLSQPGVKYLIVLESINDINELAETDFPNYTVTAAQLEQGLAQLVARAHEHGIFVLGGTIAPYQGFVFFSQNGEQIREALNQWILTSGVFDATIDFDKAMGDPASPLTLAAQYDSGDHLHPIDLGYLAMADCFDLSRFE
jgi:lysophospholipase L1-like esterase